MFISACLLTTLSELTAKLATQERHHALVEDQRACACASSSIPTPPLSSPPAKNCSQCSQQGSCPITIVLSKSNLVKVGSMFRMSLNLVIFKMVCVDIDTLNVVNFMNTKKHKLNAKTSIAEKTRATPVDVCSLLVSLRIVWN